MTTPNKTNPTVTMKTQQEMDAEPGFWDHTVGAAQAVKRGWQRMKFRNPFGWDDTPTEDFDKRRKEEKLAKLREARASEDEEIAKLEEELANLD